MNTTDNQENLKLKVHTTRLLRQITQDCKSQEDIAALIKPIQTLQRLLIGVAQRSAEINDPALNSLMCRMSLYSISDPDDDDYDELKTNKVVYMNDMKGSCNSQKGTKTMNEWLGGA